MANIANQFYVTFIANLLCLGYGLATGSTTSSQAIVAHEIFNFLVRHRLDECGCAAIEIGTISTQEWADNE